jgi:hypothetical protein
MSNRIQVGANLLCIINGQRWGAVTGMTYRLLSPRTEERGLDSMEMTELTPTTVSVQGTVQILMQRDDEGLEGRQLTAGLPYISSEHYFTLMLQDRASAYIAMKIDHASVDEQTWNPMAKGMVQGQFSFKGLMAKNHYNQ